MSTTSNIIDAYRKISTHNDFLFLASSYGVYRSSTEGDSWIYASNKLTATNVYDVLSYKGLVLAGTSKGVFVSNDDGANWADSTNNLASKQINCISTMNDTILLGTSKGLFKSSDTCSSWTPVNSVFADENITSIINYNGNLVVSTTEGIFLSVDSAKSWTSENDSLNSLYVNTLYVFNDTIFAGTQDGLYYGTNFPELIWNESNLGIKSKNIKSLCSYNDELLLGDKLGVRKREDLFIETTNSFPEYYTYSYTLKMLDSTICLKNSAGMFKYNMSVNKWSYISDLPNDNLSELIKHNDTTYIGYNTTGVYASYDTLASWELLKAQSDIAGLTKLDTLLYIGTPLGGIYRSNDHGLTWSQVNVGLSAFNVDFITTIDTLLYAGVGGKLHKSINKGDEWEQLSISSSRLIKTNKSFVTYAGLKTGYIIDDSLIWNEPSLFINFGDEIAEYVNINALVTLEDGGYMLFVRGCGYYLSQDSMKSWLPVNKGITEYDTEDNYRWRWVIPNQIISIGTAVYNLTNDGLFVRDFNNYSPPVKPICYSASSSGSSVSAMWDETEYSTVFFSNKDSYFSYDTTYYTVSVMADADETSKGFGSNASNEDYFMASYDNGDVSQFVPVIENTSAVDPFSVDLQSNIKVYPTIVENIITIEYSENIRNATLLITDLSGKILISESLDSTEIQKEIDLSSLNSGMYFLQLNTDKTKESIKILKQ